MNCFYFDIAQAGYSIIGAMLSEETGTLMIMADTFTKIDEKAVGYMLKDRYHEIRKVRFIKDEHPVLPSQPTYVDRFKKMVFSDKHYVIGWNMADKVNRLENLDNLGCIAVWKSVHRTDAKTVFKAHRHIVDISTLNPKSNRNLELQGLYQLDFIKSSPEFDECGTDMENMKLIESVTSRVIAVRNLFQYTREHLKRTGTLLSGMILTISSRTQAPTSQRTLLRKTGKRPLRTAISYRMTILPNKAQ